MASAALPTDQTRDRIVEEKKEVDNTKDTNGDDVSRPKEPDSKDEEANLKVESSTHSEIALTVSEEKPTGENDSTVEVKKEEGNNDKACHGVEEVDNPKREAEISAPSEPAPEDTGEELKNQPEVSNTPVPQSEAVENQEEDFEASSIQESESEASKKQAVPEPVTEKVKDEVTEPSTIPSSISETEDQQKEPSTVSTAEAPASNGIETLGAAEEGANASQDEDKKFEETVALENSGSVGTDVAQLQAGKGAVAFEATDAPEKTGADFNAERDVEESAKEEMGSGMVKEVAVDAGKSDPSAAIELVEAADPSSAIEIIEDSMTPEAKVEEQKQEEEIIEAEEPNLSEKSRIDAASEVAEVVYEGERVSGSIEKVEEEKNESLESKEPTLAETSKDFKANAEVSELSSEERKVCEGAAVMEDKDEHLKGKEEITKYVDAGSMSAEASSREEKASEGAAMLEETKAEGLKDEKIAGVETSKDSDAASEVVEFSSLEKVSAGSPGIVAEKKEESLDSEKATLFETKDSDAAEVSSKDEKSSVAAEIVDEKKDDSLESDKTTTVETSKDLNVVADISGVSLSEEKTYGGTGMVQEKKDEGEKAPKTTEMINEKKNEVLESARKTLGETFKEHDAEEKKVIVGSAGDAGEVEKDMELARDIAESGKPDDRNLAEPSKDGDVSKQHSEAPKQEVQKASQHHSNNIISKVKHSIVKAKKAILGKSPSSKTMSTGAKDDIKVK